MTYFCLVLYDRFGVHYELPLLIQSLIMTVTMLIMMHICVTVKKESAPTTIHRSIWDINYFWKWTDFREYLIFTGLFSLVGFIVTLLLINVSVFVELLGFASLFTEAMLGLPQFWKNYKHKSTEGMSIQMVLFWLSGDTFKTIYFIMRGAPVQFVVCGSLQVMVDIAILSQVVVYRKKRQHFISASLSIKS
ncbi:PREDICTED: PQ-loop repeat-containing protein 1-like [Amphimedon queenslandica]|uniref:PQ-loop repeat-containing protein 1 n=1 Tax=Amphimedon queenslandica TaxID=400682 RepID=A0A1X7SVB4_AMPQE|nr:PREDICTED: PQ-loop repeat-containing protein 1-like [Amphimedon queenslandica]|eukprot:XP_003391574.2 PREDICTED: PQ-loop repeat-containing protein 1-like [Amphimedon queenslandica]